MPYEQHQPPIRDEKCSCTFLMWCDIMWHIIYYPFNFQACHKSEYCPGPSVTGPRRKRSQYWPWICAPGNTGMASHLGRRLMQMRNQYWPRAILQYCPRAILQYYPRSILQYWPRAILQYCPWSILASGLKLACDLNGRSYPNCLGHISMVNTETSSYMVLSH